MGLFARTSATVTDALLQEKVFVGNRIDNRMIDAMEMAAVLPIAGAMV